MLSILQRQIREIYASDGSDSSSDVVFCNPINYAKIKTLVFFLLISIFLFVNSVRAEEALDYNKQISDDIILGQSNAPVTIVEYSSMSCPMCAYLHNDIFPTIEEKYINTKKVKWIFRHYPMYTNDIKAAKVTLCDNNSKYYIFIKALFKTQKNWAHESHNTEETLENIAKLGGLDGEKIQECFSNTMLEEKVLDSRKIAQNVLKVEATPTVIINGKVYKDGISKKGLLNAIDNALLSS